MKDVANPLCLVVCDGLIDRMHKEDAYYEENGSLPCFQHDYNSDFWMDIRKPNHRRRRVVIVPIQAHDRKKSKASRIRFTCSCPEVVEVSVLIIGLLDERKQLTHYYAEEMRLLKDRFTRPDSDTRWYISFSSKEMKEMFINVHFPMKGLLGNQPTVTERMNELTQKESHEKS